MPKQYKKGVINAVNRVKRDIEQNPANGISTAKLAQGAGISRNVLQEVFKEKFGTPIGLYRLQHRMQHAVEYLKAGKSIKEIAIILQYSSPSSFSNAFRNHFEVSPTEWITHHEESNANKQGKL